jgi:beta-lactamase superfamily II metal-dependent hydrolase
MEGELLTCCTSELSADILIAGHHGSTTSSRKLFLNAVSASTFIVSNWTHEIRHRRVAG